MGMDRAVCTAVVVLVPPEYEIAGFPPPPVPGFTQGNFRFTPSLEWWFRKMLRLRCDSYKTVGDGELLNGDRFFGDKNLVQPRFEPLPENFFALAGKVKWSGLDRDFSLVA